MTRIKQGVFDTIGDKRHQAQSFEESRFTSVPDVLEKGMTSCGALTNVFGATLRRIGIPVKYVHGRYQDKEGTYSHSWLDIYEPATGQWIEADPKTEGFTIEQGAQRIKAYHDWHELKEEYEQGRFTPE